MRLARLDHARGHDDGRLAHRRRSWRRASTPTSASRPSTTCRTRSPGSPRRSRVSTPSSCAARATARCSRSPTSPTRSCSSTCSASPPAGRGNRSSPVSRPTSRTVRARHGRGGRQRHRLRSDQARTRQRRGAGGRRAAAEDAVEAAAAELAAPPELHEWDRSITAAGAGAARRVQSPPRGRPHALRRRTHRVVDPVTGRARAPAARSSSTRATSAASV